MSSPYGVTYVGIDVGGSNVRSVVWAAGEATPAPSESGELPGDYDALLAMLSGMVGEGAAGVGVGLPGRVAMGETSGIVKWMPNIPYLDGRRLAEDLSELVAAPVALGNDAQLALLGEARFGAAREVDNCLLVSVGTGIGGAVMWQRRIVAGAHGTAGAFGWLPLGCGFEEGHEPDGGRLAEIGTWEQTASGSSLERRARRLDPSLAAKDLLREANSGRGDARALLLRFASEFAAGLAGLASVFDPQLVLVSGGVSKLVEEMLPVITGEFRGAASPSVRDTPIAIALHRSMAGAVGAAAFASEREGAFLR